MNNKYENIKLLTPEIFDDDLKVMFVTYTCNK